MSTFKNINITGSITCKELFYMPGDIITNGVFVGSGYLTNSKEYIYVQFPFDKIIHSSVSGILIDDKYTTLRQNDIYVYGSGDQNTKWNGDFTMINGSNGYYLRMDAKSALSNGINNSPIAIRIDGYTVTFQ